MRMQRIVWAFTALTTAAWLFGLWVDPPALNGRGVTHEVFYWNGVLAWGFMAMAIVIAARPAWLERVTKTPLDELYRWHRTLGFWALGLSVVHWVTKTLMQPILSLMTLDPVPKIVRGELAGFDLFWSQIRPFAVDSSIWATAIALLLGAMVFVKAIRYSKWLLWHKLFSVLFILLSVHSIRLMDPADAFLPLGWINIAVTLVGLRYSAVLLVRGAGREKTVKAAVTDVRVDRDVTLLTVRPEKPLSVRPGEFAFLATDGEEKHPFSVASVRPDGTLLFAVKALGDYTTNTVPTIAAGDVVSVEGPWGAFTPAFLEADGKDGSHLEVWVAGGVGIAPFYAWLESAAKRKNAAPCAKLVWCIRDRAAEPLFGRIEWLARKAGVSLHVVESKIARLDAAALFREGLPESLALCAGTGLSNAVIDAYLKAGGKRAAVRREHFDWR
mgnify:CR=1 FL=1